MYCRVLGNELHPLSSGPSIGIHSSQAPIIRHLVCIAFVVKFHGG